MPDINLHPSLYYQTMGWDVSYGVFGDNVIIDSLNRFNGQNSLSLSLKKDQPPIFCTRSLPFNYKGRSVSLSAYIKTENINEGYGGIMLMLKGNNYDIIRSEKMQSNGVTGTSGWKKYSIKLMCDFDSCKEVMAGAILTGSGRLWISNLEIAIDDIPISKVAINKSPFPADNDTAFETGSGIKFPQLDSLHINYLALLGEFWGFLKYHHPNVVRGNYNMDAMLFRTLPDVLKARNAEGLNLAFQTLLDKLGNVEKSVISNPSTKLTYIQPSFGELFQGNILSEKLKSELLSLKNRYHDSVSYYVEAVSLGNPIFKHELPYKDVFSPDEGLRLLSLFRYWNMINYFYPYRDSIGDWNAVLHEMIPKCVAAKNLTDYYLFCLQLIGSIHDTHANIWSNSQVLNRIKGKYLAPFTAKMIENKLVVTGFYDIGKGLNKTILVGDVINRINGVSVDSLISSHISFTTGSNYAVQLRELCSKNGFLLRSNDSIMEVEILRKSKYQIVSIKRIAINDAYVTDNKQTGFGLISKAIGYIYPAKLTAGSFDSLKVKFEKTKGLVIDLRCYPSINMPYTYCSWVKKDSAPFALVTLSEMTTPGTVKWGPMLSNGGDGGNCYKGKVVIIVNEETQSNAEFTAMAFQSSNNSITIGSTTAGADGNVSKIVLPCNVNTVISGIGIYYPDKLPTQRIGVRIDKVVKPTIKGIREGRDELLEEAVRIINNR